MDGKIEIRKGERVSTPDNRLVSAKGISAEIPYYLNMKYSAAGHILYKDFTGNSVSNNGGIPIHFINDYKYGNAGNPYAVTDLQGTDNSYFEWDKAGNLCFAKNNESKFFYWTEDNRMQAFHDDRESNVAFYRYDA